MTQLPKKDSALIRLAVHDLELVEKDDKYVVEMGQWHQPTFIDNADCFDEHDVEFCEVCFAGAVMAKTLKYNLEYQVFPDEVGDGPNDDRFAFLDRIRNYYFEANDLGFPDDMYIDDIRKSASSIKDFVDSMNKVKYDKDPDLFKKNMLAIADKLEEEGL